MADNPSKRVPPLAWVIGVLVVGVLVWAFTHWKSTYRPPSGGMAVPQAQSAGGDPAPPQEAYIPAPAPPPAPNGSGPTNEPGVLSQSPTPGAG